MILYYLLCTLIHTVFFLLIYLGIKGKILKVHKYMFFVSLFLPFWGALIVLVLHFQIAVKATKKKQIGVEKMKVESEIYKNFVVEDNGTAETTIPMEEALIVNTPKERRKIIMDVLNDNPREYIEFLQKAGNNEDSEVVHYAVTAMVEISKENDYKLQQLEKEYSADPQNPVILNEYSSFLWDCLEQNLMKGQVERSNRILYSSLIKKKIEITPLIDDCIRFVINSMKLENYTEAAEGLDTMDRLWKDSEQAILLRLEYLSSLGKGQEIKKLIGYVEEKKIYLSSKAKEVIAFWNN